MDTKVNIKVTNFGASHGATALKAQYIYQDSKAFFSFGKFDSFMAGQGRNRVNNACCDAQTAHKSVNQFIKVDMDNLDYWRVMLSKHS